MYIPIFTFTVTKVAGRRAALAAAVIAAAAASMMFRLDNGQSGSRVDGWTEGNSLISPARPPDPLRSARRATVGGGGCDQPTYHCECSAVGMCERYWRRLNQFYPLTS